MTPGVYNTNLGQVASHLPTDGLLALHAVCVSIGAEETVQFSSRYMYRTASTLTFYLTEVNYEYYTSTTACFKHVNYSSRF
jgi:hypothetical protein